MILLPASAIATNPSSGPLLVRILDGLLIAAFVAGIWIRMASAITLGRNWARIVSLVLFGIGVLLMLSSILTSPASINSIYLTLSVIAGLVAIIMLFRPASNAFFSPPVRPHPPESEYPPPPTSPPTPPAPP